MNRPLLSALILFLTASAALAQTSKKDTNWPSYRGRDAQGIAEGYPTPVSWNVEEKKNVLWKTALPGLGHSSPIVWGNKVFVTTAISSNNSLKVGLYGEIDPVKDDSIHEFKVYCLDKKSGNILWEKTAYKGIPKTKRHTKSTQANPTMTTDGKVVVAMFGSHGLYCYDLNGKLRWQKDFGILDSGYYMVPEAQWGFASSPVIVGERLIVQCDIQKNGFIAALDLKTGNEIWRTPRQETPTWGTPTIVRNGNKAQVVVNGYKHIGGYDLATGKELWRMSGGGDLPVPTPVYGNGLIFIANAHGQSAPLYAVKPDAMGDISLKSDSASNTGIAWSTMRNGAYMQTPLVYGNYVYSARDNGVVNCYDTKTGTRIYQERLGTGRTGFTASPVASDGKLYFTSEEGDIYVVKAGGKFEVIGTNPMGEVCMATPAISEGVMFFRTQGHLVAVGGVAK